MAKENRPEPKKWDRHHAEHLLNRSGFGGRPAEIDAFAALGMKAAVDRLLSGAPRALAEPDWLSDDRDLKMHRMRDASQEEKRQLHRRMREHNHDLIRRWVEFMIETPTPADMLHAKMTFFWHGHFATSIQKVKAPPFIFNQLSLFHRRALDNYGTLLHDIIHDPAMLRYLDNVQNRRGKPNENLGRELMELFSLGQGNYTEDDIREGARALTGYAAEPWQFRFRRGAHDYRKKQILGKTGRFDGDDFVNIILEQDACAEFMVKKLWMFFTDAQPAADTLDGLAKAFRSDSYAVKPLLRRIFTHPSFYAPDQVGAQIKSPIQLVIGSARLLGLKASAPIFYQRMLSLMGQLPLLPPNVKGWPSGRAWIDTSRLLTRFSFASLVMEGRIPRELDPRQQPRDDSSRQNRRAARRMMGDLRLTIHMDCKPFTVDTDKPARIFDRVMSTLLSVPATAGERKALENEFNAQINNGDRDDAVRQLIGKVMHLPQFQLC